MSDLVNHPAHYTQHKSGIECIDITEGMTWPNLANAFKYLWRLGLKGNGLDDEMRDLGKAIFYIRRCISQIRLISNTNEAKLVVENKRYFQAVNRFLEYEGDPVFAMLLEADSTQDGHIGLLSNVLSVLADRLDDLQAKNPWQTVDRWIEDNRELVDAIIQVESANNVNARRYEAHYKYLWDLRFDVPIRHAGKEVPDAFSSRAGVSAGTELIDQRSSWGSMQVMGAVAREYGFVGDFPELLGTLGERYGAKHLMRLKHRLSKKGQVSRNDLIAAYNYGHAKVIDDTGRYANQHYVDKVNDAIKARV